MTDPKQAGRQRKRQGHAAGIFDIRSIIGALIGVYGLVLVVMGLLGTSEADLSRAGGLNINLLAGVGMAVAASAFFVWAWARPVVVPDETTEDAEAAEDDARL